MDFTLIIIVGIFFITAYGNSGSRANMDDLLEGALAGLAAGALTLSVGLYSEAGELGYGNSVILMILGLGFLFSHFYMRNAKHKPRS